MQVSVCNHFPILVYRVLLLGSISMDYYCWDTIHIYLYSGPELGQTLFSVHNSNIM